MEPEGAVGESETPAAAQAKSAITDGDEGESGKDR